MEKSLLLNACCAPCAVNLLNDQPTFLFDGANIWPPEEQERRKSGVEKLARIKKLNFLELPYDHEEWLAYVSARTGNDPAAYPENGNRCLACFQFRLERFIVFAAHQGFTSVAATLSASRFKDRAFINRYGGFLAEKHNLDYRALPQETREDHQRAVEFCKGEGIHCQKYCGCEFSLAGGA
jgi:hypothetical protein